MLYFYVWCDDYKKKDIWRLEWGYNTSNNKNNSMLYVGRIYIKATV